MTTRKSDGVFKSDYVFIDVLDVHLGLCVGDDPLFSSLSILVVHVGEVSSSTKVKTLLIDNKVASDDLNYLLVGIGKVGTVLTDQPFLT